MQVLETLVASAIWFLCCSNFTWLCLSETSLWWPMMGNLNAWSKEEIKKSMTTFSISLKICLVISSSLKSRSIILMSFVLLSKILKVNLSILQFSKMPKNSLTFSSTNFKLLWKTLLSRIFLKTFLEESLAVKQLVLGAGLSKKDLKTSILFPCR